MFWDVIELITKLQESELDKGNNAKWEALIKEADLDGDGEVIL